MRQLRLRTWRPVSVCRSGRTRRREAKCLGVTLAQPPNSGSSIETSLMSGKRLRSSAIGELRLRRAVVVLGDDLLADRAVEIIEIGLRGLQRALLLGVAFDQRHRRLGLDRDRRHDDVELVGAELVDGEEGFVFPRTAERRPGRAARRSWSSRARRSRAPARSCRAAPMNSLALASSPLNFSLA